MLSFPERSLFCHFHFSAQIQTLESSMAANQDCGSVHAIASQLESYIAAPSSKLILRRHTLNPHHPPSPLLPCTIKYLQA
jgi:hypothetical protein